METVHSRCAGIDIGKRSLTVCAITPGPRGESVRETRGFGTLTSELLRLADWLAEREITTVAMESTGSYWKPIWNLLEDRFELLLANAAHIKAVPGRKTDVRDAEWIADLLRHGLLRASFIPPRPDRELRELVRYRARLIGERASEINRLAKVLEGANIKLGSVSTNLFLGKSRQFNFPKRSQPGTFYAEPDPTLDLRQAGRIWHGGKVLFERSWTGGQRERRLARAGLIAGGRLAGFRVKL